MSKENKKGPAFQTLICTALAKMTPRLLSTPTTAMVAKCQGEPRIANVSQQNCFYHLMSNYLRQNPVFFPSKNLYQ